MLATTLLIGLVSAAAVTDLRRHKIYNWTTYPGLLLALAGNFWGEIAVRAAWCDAETCQVWGWIGAGPSLAGMLLCGGILILSFVFFRVGGGDVKLLAMIGAFLGPDRGLQALLWTFVLGACAALAILVWRVGPLGLVRHTLGHLIWTARLGRHVPMDPELRAQLQPPLYLAPSALAAVLIVLFSLVDRL